MGSTRLTAIVATIVAVLIAAVAGVALYTSIMFANSEQATRTALQEATAYSQALDRLKDAVLDAETGQRGYLLTGDPDYLLPYERAKHVIEGFEDESWEIATLKNHDDTELRRLVTIKLTELKETIRLFDAGSPNAALSMVQTDRGQEVMADIRRIVRQRQMDAGEIVDAYADRAQAYNQRSGVVAALLAVLLGLAAIMGGFTLYQGLRARRAEVEVVEAVETAERIEVIAHELDHRMKNLFAVAQGMLRQSARGRGEAVEDFAREAVSRLLAMSHAYSATRALEDARSLPKSEIIDRVVRSQLLGQHKFGAVGPDGDVAERAVSPLALILHEWTTNALKYGAWKPDASPDSPSNVQVTWHFTEDGRYELIWDEQHEPRAEAVPTGSGYGSKLIRACASQLGGTVEYDWYDGGVRIRLTADPAIMGLSPPSKTG